MLVPLNRKTFEELVPAVATGAQYAYCWGKLRDLLSRVLISVVGIFAIILLRVLIVGEGNDGILLTIGLTIGLYWLWGPILWASLKNFEYRRYGYSGFWQGRVLDVYTSEELIGTEETVNDRGDLVVIENRERCITLEVGDSSGFSSQLRVPLKRNYRAIDIGDIAEMLVFSNRGDLGRIPQTSDIYIPDHNLWVSDYPCVQRDAFIEVSRRLNALYPEDTGPSKQSGRKRTPRSGVQPRQSDRSEPLARQNRYDEQDRRSRRSTQRSQDGRDQSYSEYPETEPPRRRSPSRRRPTSDWS
jgi:hypothetical protein